MLRALVGVAVARERVWVGMGRMMSRFTVRRRMQEMLNLMRTGARMMMRPRKSDSCRYFAFDSSWAASIIGEHSC